MKATRSDRPTMAPSFDVAQYARDSEARVARARSDGAGRRMDAPKSGRLVTSPGLGGAVVPDETWAHGLKGTPTVMMAPEQLKRLPLDHRAGFLLSLMDGGIDLEMVIELSAMSRAEVLRVVRDLCGAGVVEFIH